MKKRHPLVALLWPAALASCSAVPAAYRQPAEFEPQAAIWMSAEPNDAEFMRVTAGMIGALQGHVSIRMLVRDDATLAATREGLQQAGVALEAIEFTTDPLATLFLRDGTVFLVNGEGGRAVLDFKWSLYGLPGWCQRLYPDDPKLAAECVGYLNAEQDAFDRSFARAWSAEVIPSTLFLENAAIEVNGRGVLLISEPLALERNPGRSRAEIEAALLRIPGIRKVIWLDAGLAEDPLEMSTIEGPYVGLGAGGHTDEYVRFADAHTILLAWVGDEQVDLHPLGRINRARMQRNAEILAAASDQDGQPFRIIQIPMPAVIERKVVLAPKTDQSSNWNEANFPASEGRKAGDELIQVASASYLNLVIANDLVLVPSFVEDGTPRELEDEVGRLLGAAFPGRTIRFLRATPLSWNGGGPHCATLSEPRVR
jgi:agmatine deiminase